MRFSKFFFLTAIVLMMSCTEELDMIDIHEETFTPITNVEIASLVVSIRQDLPFSCEINDQIFTSDGGGVLLIEKILLDKNGSSIMIKSDGHFDEIRYVIPTLDANLYIEVELTDFNSSSGISSEIDGFNAEEGGIIDVFGNEITFKSNSIVDEFGNVYNGEINIFAFYTIGTAFYTNIKSFPQNYYKANDISNTLNFVGGLNLVFRDEMMNPLFMKEGETADVSLKITGFPGGEIPDVVDMISYDEQKDDWISMGIAEKNGERWFGSINHLGNMLWGILQENRVAEVKLVTDQGVPIPNKFVWVYINFDTPLTVAFTNNKGIARVHVPVGAEFFINTIQKSDIEIVKSTKFSEIESGDGSVLLLEDIVADSDLYQVYTGSIVDCLGEIISNSAIIGEGPKELGTSGYQTYVFSDENGIFNFAFPSVLFNTINVKAFDFNSNSTTELFLVPNDNDEEVNLGNLTICEEHEYFINYSIGNENYFYTHEGSFDSELFETTYVSTFQASSSIGANEDNQTSFSIEHETSFVPFMTYQIRDLKIKLMDGSSDYDFQCDGDCNHAITINRITVQYFEGVIKDTSDPTSEVIIGAFRIPRQ